jgi:DNA-binding beta-propeller fold protein YncE
MNPVYAAARGAGVRAAGLAALAVAVIWGTTAPPARGDLLYVTNIADNTVSVVSTSGGTPTTFAAGFSGPTGLAFDATGNLFVTGGGMVSEVKAGTNTPIPFASGFSDPVFLAVQAVPEPSMLISALSGLALTGVFYARRKRRRARAGA